MPLIFMLSSIKGEAWRREMRGYKISPLLWLQLTGWMKTARVAEGRDHLVWDSGCRSLTEKKKKIWSNIADEPQQWKRLFNLVIQKFTLTSEEQIVQCWRSCEMGRVSERWRGKGVYLGGAGDVGEWVKFRVLGSSEGFQNKRGFELVCCKRSQQRGR